jgi:hypothetical protein
MITTAPLEGWYSDRRGRVSLALETTIRPGIPTDFTVPPGSAQHVWTQALTETFQATLTTVRRGT